MLSVRSRRTVQCAWGIADKSGKGLMGVSQIPVETNIVSAMREKPKYMRDVSTTDDQDRVTAQNGACAPAKPLVRDYFLFATRPRLNATLS